MRGAFDWVPHNLREECLPVSRLGQYSTVQMSGQGYKELFHKQQLQGLAGVVLLKKGKPTTEMGTAGTTQMFVLAMKYMMHSDWMGRGVWEVGWNWC